MLNVMCYVLDSDVGEMIADIIVMYMLGTWRFAVTKVHVGT